MLRESLKEKYNKNNNVYNNERPALVFSFALKWLKENINISKETN